MSTKQTASWVHDLDSSKIPESTRKAALRSLYNYLGCLIYGSVHPTVIKTVSALKYFSGEETTVLLGTGYATDAQNAALLYGIASHVHDYDDTHLDTIIHPTGPVASALLTYIQHIGFTGKKNWSGSDLLTALIAGIEVECKLGLAVYPRHYDAGWHITSTTGSIGAAVAVAKLMNLSPSEITNAIGVAATQVTGLRCNFGTDTKPFHVGRAAQNGLLAAILAQQGFTSEETSIEAKRGWINVATGGEQFNKDLKVEDLLQTRINELGKTWETEKNTFKPYPCGIVAHPSIQCAIDLRKQILVDVKDQDHLREKLKTLKFNSYVNDLVKELTDKESPRDGLEAKFSVQHGIAVGLLYDKAGPAEYDHPFINNPDVVEIRKKVHVAGTVGIRSDAAVLQALDLATTEPGDWKYSTNVDHAIGSIVFPMTDDQLTTKFVDQVSLRFVRSDVKNVSDLCWQFGKTDNVYDLIQSIRNTPLTPAPLGN